MTEYRPELHRDPLRLGDGPHHYASPAIIAADRVTVTIGNAGITTYTRRIDVLPRRCE